MTFCSNCGHQLTGNEKFCAGCGADTATKAATPPAANFVPQAVPVPAPMPMAQPMMAQPMTGAPYPGVPVAVGVPPPAQPAQKKGMMGTVVVVILLAGIGYYYYNKLHASPTPAPSPTPAAQNPPASGTGSGGGNGSGNSALVNQQTFTAHWQDQSGMLVLTTATWVNNSTTNITTATLQCRQFNAAGTDLSEYRVTLNGPTNAGTTSNFSNVSLGATAAGMTKVDCSIIHVKPVG